jgi:hypothetical protein
LDKVWQETPHYSERYHLFRFVAHLAKYWTAEQAVQAAKWAMEVHGGMGVLAEYGVERWLREAMILPIWEGTPHRQILDGLEAMQRARMSYFSGIAPYAAHRRWKRPHGGSLADPPQDEGAQAETFRRLAFSRRCSAG